MGRGEVGGGTGGRWSGVRRRSLSADSPAALQAGGGAVGLKSTHSPPPPSPRYLLPLDAPLTSTHHPSHARETAGTATPSTPSHPRPPRATHLEGGKDQQSRRATHHAGGYDHQVLHDEGTRGAPPPGPPAPPTGCGRAAEEGGGGCVGNGAIGRNLLPRLRLRSLPASYAVST
jgi:hypothetical protein